MNLLFRMFWLALTLRADPEPRPFDPVSLALRVWPNDLDVQRHMNNGRYLSIMDLGRIAFMIRLGFWRLVKAHGWFTLVGSIRIDYRRPLAPFQRYTLETRLTGWDDRWFFLEQRFIAGGKTVAEAHVKAMVRSRTGLVSPAEAMAALGLDLASPELPEAARALR